jgi:hypothetical protein
MAKATQCRLCKDLHDPLMGCRQWARIKAASTATITDASTPASTTKVTVVASTVEEACKKLEARAEGAAGLKQRWSRDEYNRWMNLYRQSVRALKAEKACPWPRTA